MSILYFRILNVFLQGDNESAWLLVVLQHQPTRGLTYLKLASIYSIKLSI